MLGDNNNSDLDTQSLAGPPQSKFLQEVCARGFLYQCSDVYKLDRYLCQFSNEQPNIANFINNISNVKNTNNNRAVAYAGFDMTAKSLHVGNLVSIMLLKWFEIYGHKPLILLGDATTRIGDPSDKNEMRPMLSEENIYDNMACIRKFFDKAFHSAEIVNNFAWLGQLGYIEILREVGACFSVNKMMSMDIFKRRIDDNISLTFLELNYLILQSYDFLHLNRHYDCCLQFGGSDQWTNIISGVDLIRRKSSDVLASENNLNKCVMKNEAFAFTTPLITTANGKKMGKTAQGAVWLNADMMTPYEFWQFWRNVEDKDVMRFLKIYTLLSLEEIQETCNGDSAAVINNAKIVLANSVTQFVHGDEALQQVTIGSSNTMINVKFDESELTEYKCSYAIISEANEVISGIDFPFHIEADRDCKEYIIRKGVHIIDILLKANLCKSKGEARRLLSGGGVKYQNGNATPNKTISEKSIVSFVLSPISHSEAVQSVILSIGKGKRIFCEFIFAS
jgi:tyrosyl-tRNA synthetase